MAVGKKATRRSADVDVDALIDRGGSHAGDAEASDQDNVQKITVRLPKDFVRRIDDALHER